MNITRTVPGVIIFSQIEKIKSIKHRKSCLHLFVWRIMRNLISLPLNCLMTRPSQQINGNTFEILRSYEQTKRMKCVRWNNILIALLNIIQLTLWDITLQWFVFTTLPCLVPQAIRIIKCKISLFQLISKWMMCQLITEPIEEMCKNFHIE